MAEVGDAVVWCAASSQRLPAVVAAVNEDGTLALRVRSDSADEVWTEHARVAYGEPGAPVETWCNDYDLGHEERKAYEDLRKRLGRA